MCISVAEQHGIVDVRLGRVATDSWLEAEADGRMALPPLEPEKDCLSGPKQEDVWVRLTPSPPAALSQAVILEVKRCSSQPTGEGGGVGNEGTSSRTGLRCEEDVQLEEPSVNPEESLSNHWIPDQGVREVGQSCKNPDDSSAACSPEPAWLPSGARGKAGGASLSPASARKETCRPGAGDELPSPETVVAMENVSLSEDRLPGGGEQEDARQPCPILADEASGEEQECPICTETYDRDQRRPTLLNCGHVLCGRCLCSIMEAATTADIGRVRCPICRQKTPMMEWEICKLQEELLLLHSEPSPVSAPPVLNVLPVRRAGFWGSLEYHFQVRFHTTRMIGFLPCLRYPPCLIGGLARLERRCRCCYRLALLLLLVGEMLSLLLVFLPIVLLLLLFLILDR